MNTTRADIQVFRAALQIGPFTFGLVGAFARPNLVFDMDEKSAAQTNFQVHDRFIAGYFPFYPVFALGIFDGKAEFVKEQPKPKVSLSVRTELPHVPS